MQDRQQQEAEYQRLMVRTAAILRKCADEFRDCKLGPTETILVSPDDVQWSTAEQLKFKAEGRPPLEINRVPRFRREQVS